MPVSKDNVGFGDVFYMEEDWEVFAFNEAKETISANPLVSLYFGVPGKCKGMHIHMR